MVEYRDALRLMEASLQLRVNKVTFCDRSRDAINQIKDSGPLGDLLDSLIVTNEEGAVAGNAGDVFDTAQRLAQLGEGLPYDDKKICQ